MVRSYFLFFVFFVIVAITTAAADEDDGPQVERRGDLELMIDRKYDLPRCLSDSDILELSKLTSEEIQRIRDNTEAILSGAFKKYTNNFDFYSNQRTANNARTEKKEKNPSIPFEGTVIIDAGFWSSIQLSSVVAGLLLKEVMHYPVEVWQIPFTVLENPYARLASGATHFYLEQWGSDDTGQFQQFVRQKQTVLDMGVQGYMGQYGIYVPQYMTKADPRIDHWQSLRLSSSLFRRFDPANYRNLPTRKDRLAIIDAFLCKDTSCKDGFFIPPQCKNNPKKCKELLVGTPDYAFGAIQQMITNLKLPFVVVFVDETVMWSVIAERIKKEDPVLFMHWSPSEYLLNGTTYNKVSFPDYTPECYANRIYEAVGSIDCDFPPNFMQKSAWADTATEMPSAKELISRLSFTDLEMNTMTIDLLRRQRKKPSPLDQWKTACKWLRNSTNAGSWTPWIPVPREPEMTDIPTWEIAVILTIAAICILLELLAGVLVFCFRKRTIIKFGEPMFLYIMSLGSILATVGVIFNAVPSPVETYSCQITVWFICFGFTLFFGALFAKTLRLVWIFFQMERLKPNPKQFLFKKSLLFLVLGGLLCIDLVILTTWTASDTLQAKSVQSDDDPLVYSTLCRSSNDTIYIIVLATYKCILIGVTAIMAFMARKLPNVLNESYFITMAVYNVGLFTSIVLPVSAVLHDDLEASMIVRSIGILLCGVASLGLLVIPKMWVIFKGQHGAAEDDAIMDNLKISKGSKSPTSNNQSASHPSSLDST